MKKSFSFVFICFAIITCFPKWVLAQNLTVGSYSLVSSQRVSRFEYDYTYRADITNTGPAVQNVTASLTSNSQYTTVIEGDLTFGDVPVGETVTSSDTFIIRVNRRYPFSEDDLIWDISLPDSTPPTLSIDYPADEAYVGTVTPNIVISFDDTGSGINLDSFYVEINGVDYTDYFTVSETGASYQVPELEPLPEDINYILVSIQDNEGNFTEASSNFYVKTLKLIERVSKVIPASEGGEIEITENESMYNAGVKLEIPPGALTEDTEIKVSDIVDGYPPFPENTAVVGLPIYFGPTGLTFSTQATLRIPYTDEELIFSKVGDPSEIRVITYNSATEVWEEVPVESIDTVNKYLIVKISHFTIFSKISDFVEGLFGYKEKEDEVFKFVRDTWGIVKTPDKLKTILAPNSSFHFLPKVPAFDAVSGVIALRGMSNDIFNDRHADAAYKAKKWSVPVLLKYSGHPWLAAGASLAFTLNDSFQALIKELDEKAFDRQVSNYLAWREQGWSHEDIIEPNSDTRNSVGGWLLNPNCFIQFFCNSKPGLTGKWKPEHVFEMGKLYYNLKKTKESQQLDEDAIKAYIQNALDNLDAGLEPTPKIVITPSEQKGNPPFTATFDGSQSEGSIISYLWNFGDGSTSSDASTSHTYTEPGNYPVTLTVTDSEGREANTQTYIEVVTYNLDNQPPMADFSCSIDSGNSLKVYCDASSSYDPDGSLVQYRWSFGDGNVQYDTSPATNIYTEAGQYEVKLQVTDNDTASSEKTTILEVTEEQTLSAPTNLRVSGNANNLSPVGVTLNWNSVEGNGVTYCTIVNEDSEPWDIPVYQGCDNNEFLSETSLTLPMNLDNEKTYWWAIWAKDVNDVWSPSSNWSSFTTGIDTDGDGVIDSQDQCPNTSQGETVDSNGCAASEIDSDNDGVPDINDSCPNTPTGGKGHVDIHGCMTFDSEKSGTLIADETWTGAILVTGNVTVSAGYVLRIEPGTALVFNNNTRLFISGKLEAYGTSEANIVFTSSSSTPTQGNWNGIYFDHNSLNTSVIDFAVIEYANYGLTCEYASPAIRNSIIRNCNLGMYLNTSDSLIENNQITNNGSYGIYITNSSNSVIRGNLFENNNMGCYMGGSGITVSILNNHFAGNPYGIYGNNASSPSIIKNNIIRESNNHGIYLHQIYGNGNYDISYNTIDGSGYGISLDGSSGQSFSISVKANIITNNEYGFYRGNNIGTVTSSYNNVWGNNTSYGGYISEGSGDISVDPKYADWLGEDFRLSSTSPCKTADENGGEIGAYGGIPYLPTLHNILLSVTGELYNESAAHESVYARISNLQNGTITPEDDADNFMNDHANPQGAGIEPSGDTLITHLLDNTWGDSLNFDSSFNTVFDDSPGHDSGGVFEVVSVTDEGGSVRGTYNTNAYYFSYDGLNDGIGDAITLTQWVNYLEQISNTYGRIGRLTIFVHGSSGNLHMSDSFTLTTNNLNNDDTVRNQLSRLQNILTNDAHILLFSCKVAKNGLFDSNGTDFIQELANLTDAVVHANEDYTGNYNDAWLGSDTDWSLDVVATPNN